MIKIRPMTMREYDDYEEMLEALKNKNYDEAKLNRKMAMYVCEKVYGMDLNDKNSTVAKCIDIYIKTIKATSEQEQEEEKN